VMELIRRSHIETTGKEYEIVKQDPALMKYMRRGEPTPDDDAPEA